MNEKETGGLAKELGELTAKVDMMLQTVNKLAETVPTRNEFDDLKRRVDKQENAPTRWLPIIIAGLALLLQFMQK